MHEKKEDGLDFGLSLLNVCLCGLREFDGMHSLLRYFQPLPKSTTSLHHLSHPHSQPLQHPHQQKQQQKQRIGLRDGTEEEREEQRYTVEEWEKAGLDVGVWDAIPLGIRREVLDGVWRDAKMGGSSSSLGSGSGSPVATRGDSYDEGETGSGGRVLNGDGGSTVKGTRLGTGVDAKKKKRRKSDGIVQGQRRKAGDSEIMALWKKRME
jgi:hypothetical protein